MSRKVFVIVVSNDSLVNRTVSRLSHKDVDHNVSTNMYMYMLNKKTSSMAPVKPNPLLFYNTNATGHYLLWDKVNLLNKTHTGLSIGLKRLLT